jgi:hypothetical protein
MPLHSGDLVNSLAGFKKEKIWKVIHFLKSEDRISITQEGLIAAKEGL